MRVFERYERALFYLTGHRAAAPWEAHRGRGKKILWSAAQPRNFSEIFAFQHLEREFLAIKMAMFS